MPSNANSSKTYIRKCAHSMWKEFGGVVVIKIMQASDPHVYPTGMWFDRLIGSTMDVAGIDFTVAPNLFIMADGSSVPCDYAEIVEILRA